MRVFTDGACSHNGRPGAKAGYAVWFPDAKDLSESARVPATEAQTNQRAELSAIHRAIVILDANGYHGEDIKIYTDSEYSINCLTKWISGGCHEAGRRLREAMSFIAISFRQRAPCSPSSRVIGLFTCELTRGTKMICPNRMMWSIGWLGQRLMRQ
jgi:ribonuclease HI